MQQVKVQNHQTYNDGVLELYEKTLKYNEARKLIGEDLKYIGKLQFSKEYQRTQDIEFAESISKKLELKLKTPKKRFSLDCKIKINGEMYECFKLDEDNPFSNYLYLQKVGLNE